jgi:hypothetical protein
VCVYMCVYPAMQRKWGAWYSKRTHTKSQHEKEPTQQNKKSGFNTTLFPGGPPPQY